MTKDLTTGSPMRLIAGFNRHQSGALLIGGVIPGILVT